jgi:DnaJ family protein A protein 2
MGGRQKRGGKKTQKKGESATRAFDVSLEDLYNGKNIKLALTKNVLCFTCKGKGSENPGVTVTCKTCRGNGIVVKMQRLGPGMMQQVQTHCPDCRGTGESISDADRCKTCVGRKVTEDKKVLEVHIEKGMMNNQKITFRGESDQAPDTDPGDVVIVLRESPHRTFKRDGSHLYVEKKISLKEALCGFQIQIEHFNKRVVTVRSNPGENIIGQGQIMKIPEEGMPVYKKPYIKGNLYIKFEVVFPRPGQLTAPEIKALTSTLPGPALPSVTSPDCLKIEQFDPNEVDPAKRSDKQAYEDDDEEARTHHGGGGGVQCAHQ